MTFRLSPCIWCKWSVDICRMSWVLFPQDQGPIEIRGAPRISPGVFPPRGLPRMDDRSWEAAMSLAERASLHTVSQMHLVCWQVDLTMGRLGFVFFKIFGDLKTATAVKRFLTDDRGDGTGDEGRTTFSTTKGESFWLHGLTWWGLIESIDLSRPSWEPIFR